MFSPFLMILLTWPLPPLLPLIPPPSLPLEQAVPCIVNLGSMNEIPESPLTPSLPLNSHILFLPSFINLKFVLTQAI